VRLKGLVARDHDLNAQLVAHLAELDTRDVFLREGYASLFVYCRDALGLSEWEAYNRIEVARATRRFPVILDMLAEGSVNLTAVRLLAPHLTPGNHREVLDSARGKRKPEVEGIVAGLAPRHAESPPASRHERGDGRSLGPRQTRGLAAGPRALRVRWHERPSMQRASVRAVPPRRSARSGRRGDRRHDRAAVP